MNYEVSSAKSIDITLNFNPDVAKNRIFIFGSGGQAWALGEEMLGKNMEFDGFVDFTPRRKIILERPVLTLEEFKRLDDAVILLSRVKWQVAYDRLFQAGLEDVVYYADNFWKAEEKRCLVCDNTHTMSCYGAFYPFLTERAFGGKERKTRLMHCPGRGMYWSDYRPTDEEMDRLYTGYRDEKYQIQRQSYEPGYTAELNTMLSGTREGSLARQKVVYELLRNHTDIDACEYYLDYGGERGENIPQNINAKKYVYEVSGVEPVSGVTMIKDRNELRKYAWDIICCENLMEHLSDVSGFFQTLCSYMNENTLLYVYVPKELGTVQDRKFCFIHEHINFFSEMAFEKLAEENDLQVVCLSSVEGKILGLFRKVWQNKNGKN